MVRVWRAMGDEVGCDLAHGGGIVTRKASVEFCVFLVRILEGGRDLCIRVEKGVRNGKTDTVKKKDGPTHEQ